MSTPNRRSTDSFYVKPQVNERPLRRATDSFVDGVVIKNGHFVNRPIVSDSLSKAIPIRKETLPSRPHNGSEQIDSVQHHHQNSSGVMTPSESSEDNKLSGRIFGSNISRCNQMQGPK